MTTISEIKNLKPRYVKHLVFKGADLFCKGGFEDGDLLEGHVEMDDDLYAFNRSLYDGEPCVTIFERITTIALAELYLLPKFDRPLELWFANYLHNGCRVSNEPWWPEHDWKFAWTLPSVTLDSDTVYSMLHSMKAVFEAWLRKEPIQFPAILKQTAAILSDELKYPVTINESLACLPSTSLSLPIPQS